MRTRSLSSYLALWILLLSGTAAHLSFAAIDLPAELTLAVGDQQVVEARQIESFSESTRGIIEVKIPRHGRQMILTAVRPGSTSLLLIGRDGTRQTIAISVFAVNPDQIERELTQLFGAVPNLSFRRVGPRIFVDGSVGSDAALRRVEQVEQIYKGQVASLVQLDPQAVQKRTNIRFDLVFVELRRSDAIKFGMSWPDQIGAGTLSGTIDLVNSAVAASYSIVDQTMPFLEAGQRAGWAKIRKRATLLTTSGNQATYLSGGEVNIAVAGSQAAELRAIPYGCQLTVLPHLAPSSGLLDIQVKAEVSDLTETTQDIPGRTISQVETLVHMGLGQTIVLSGLDSESEINGTHGLPFLSRIPILGLLFGGWRHRDEQVDGIILITPTVIENIDREGQRALKTALEKFESFDGEW